MADIKNIICKQYVDWLFHYLTNACNHSHVNSEKAPPEVSENLNKCIFNVNIFIYLHACQDVKSYSKLVAILFLILTIIIPRNLFFVKIIFLVLNSKFNVFTE